MQVVVEKLNELLVELSNKNIVAAQKEADLIKKENELQDKIHKADVVLKALKEREDKLIQFESAVKVLNDAKQKSDEAHSQALINSKDSELIIKQKSQVEKLQADAAQQKKLYLAKLKKCDALEIELKEKEKNLRAKILEELKGKLNASI